MAGTPSARASAIAVSITCRCPRWTPSNVPSAMARLPGRDVGERLVEAQRHRYGLPASTASGRATPCSQVATASSAPVASSSTTRAVAGLDLDGPAVQHRPAARGVQAHGRQVRQRLGRLAPVRRLVGPGARLVGPDGVGELERARSPCAAGPRSTPRCRPRRRGRGRAPARRCPSSSARRARPPGAPRRRRTSSRPWTVTVRDGISTSSPRRKRRYARSPSTCTALAAGGTWTMRPAQGLERRLDRRAVARGAGRHELALGIVGRRARAEAHRRPVALVEAGEEAREPRRPAREHQQQPGGERVERPGVADAPAQHRPQRRDGAERARAGGLVEQQHAGSRRRPRARHRRRARAR